MRRCPWPVWRAGGSFCFLCAARRGGLCLESGRLPVRGIGGAGEDIRAVLLPPRPWAAAEGGAGLSISYGLVQSFGGADPWPQKGPGTPPVPDPLCGSYRVELSPPRYRFMPKNAGCGMIRLVLTWDDDAAVRGGPVTDAELGRSEPTIAPAVSSRPKDHSRDGFEGIFILVRYPHAGARRLLFAGAYPQAGPRRLPVILLDRRGGIFPMARARHRLGWRTGERSSLSGEKAPAGPR